MYCEVIGDGLLRSTEALGNGAAAKDATRTWGMPQWAGVGEKIRVNVREVRQLEQVLDLGLRLVDRTGADECGHGDHSWLIEGLRENR